MACCPSFRICRLQNACFLSLTIAWDQLITWFSWVACSVRTDLLSSIKLDARRLLVNVWTKRTMSSTGLKRRWSTESQSVLPDGSKRPYTSERKDNRPWTVMRAATNRTTHTTAFLTRRLPVVSRTRRTEYQLLLMKASDRGRNVKF